MRKIAQSARRHHEIEGSGYSEAEKIGRECRADVNVSREDMAIKGANYLRGLL